MDRTRRRQGYLERYNAKTGKWERARGAKPTATPEPTAKPTVKPPASTGKPPVTTPTPTRPNPFTSGKPNANAAMTGVKGAIRAASGAKSLLGAAGTAAAIGTTAMSVFNPKDNIITRLGKLGDSIERAVGPGGGAPRPAKPNKPRVGNIPPAEGTGRGGPSDIRKPSPTASTPTRSQAPTQRTPQTTRSSTPSRPSSPAAPAKPAAPAAPKDRRVSAATANREAGNYGTSRTNNPMIDDAMKARMRQREDAAGVGPVKDGARYAADVKGSTRGVGPVADGQKYASNVKPSSSTPAKKKEDETKTMSIAERLRRRRAGLA